MADSITGKGSPEATLLLKLFSNNYTPVAASVAGSFTSATFTGYAIKTLSAAGWNAATTVAGKGVAVYGTAQTWASTSSETIYGYFIVGGSSGILYWAETFASPRPIASGDTISITPQISVNSEN